MAAKGGKGKRKGKGSTDGFFSNSGSTAVSETGSDVHTIPVVNIAEAQLAAAAALKVPTQPPASPNLRSAQPPTWQDRERQSSSGDYGSALTPSTGGLARAGPSGNYSNGHYNNGHRPSNSSSTGAPPRGPMEQHPFHPPHMPNSHAEAYGLSIDLVDEVFRSATTLCKIKRFPPMSFAAVDISGNVMAIRRMDGAMLLTPQIAQAKAYTAAVLRRPSSDVLRDAEDRPHFYNSLKDLSPVPVIPGPGGIPICKGNMVVGAVSASGGTPEQDVEVLVEALATLGLKKASIGLNGPACFKIPKE